MIQFTCEHCGRRLSIADAHAGKKGRCPHCKQIVCVPQAGATPPARGSEPSDEPAATPKWSAQDEALLNLPHELPKSPAHESGDAATGADAQDTVEPEVADSSEASPDVPPRFTDVLLYPTNLDGLVQIGILAFCLWLAKLFGGLLATFARPYGVLLAIIAYVVVAGYVVFYIGYCIYDSSQGGRRAPTVSLAHTPGMSDLLSQLLLLVAGVAICLWPAAIYRGVAGRADAWLWVLGGAGAFFLPMSLLTAALFDGIDALNPVLIVRSILVTLPAYLGLVVRLGLLGGIFLVLRSALGRLPVPQVLSMAAYLYLSLIAAHLLGRFYWRWKDRLEWGL